MSDGRPILAFAPPTAGSIPAGPPQFPPGPRRPSAAQQGARLTPRFTALSEALDNRRIAASATTAAPDPELVVVFDLAGTVDGFMRAVRDIPGLEFLAEYEEEPREPDENFALVGKHGEDVDRSIPETLYLVMSNAQAVTELVRLFALWQQDQSVTFPLGAAPLKAAFGLLRDVRLWGPEDRVRETGLLERWNEDVAVTGASGSARIEVELWFRSQSATRSAAEQDVRQIISRSGGAVIRSAVIEGIDYHAILADLPYSQVQSVLDDGVGSIEILRSESVMFVSPAVPMAYRAVESQPDGFDAAALPAPPTVAPRVALLDGAPMANHDVLTGRLIIDDPDGIAALYTNAQQMHGTAMASIICHGDLSSPKAPLTTSLYVRPVLQPHPFAADVEQVIPDQLLVDLVHRSFVRIFEGDGTNPPSAPSVRIVNLSIGDPVRAFTRHLSPLAKLLDWLSHKYNVLVVVSAGNHDTRFTVAFDALQDPDALQRTLLQGQYEQVRLRRLLSPAEAINVLTVGATHDDASTAPNVGTVVDGIGRGLPALYGATGGGLRRSVKPEVLLPGGRQMLRVPPAMTGIDDVDLVGAQHPSTGPGVLVAAPSPGGGTRGTSYLHGTSNAAALASHMASRVFDLLESPTTDPQDSPLPGAQYHPVAC